MNSVSWQGTRRRRAWYCRQHPEVVGVWVHTELSVASNESGMMTSIALAKLLAGLEDRTATELKSKPDVVDTGHELDVTNLPIVARKWHKATEVFAVFADLKNSSRLGTNMHAASTASVYEAAVGGLVEVFDRFEANYIDIQGDAAFGVFWGDNRLQRAITAGITIKTFSVDMVAQFEKKWPEQPETGFRVGIAASPILVKRIGTAGKLAQQKPVWAGRAVNYASKAGSAGDRHDLVVTGTVWDLIESNDYLTLSCDCAEASDSIWENVTIERLRDGDEFEAAGRRLTSKWCAVHGPEYCQAILDGKTARSTITAAQRDHVLATQTADAFRQQARKERLWRRQGTRL